LEFGTRIGKLCHHKTGQEKGAHNNEDISQSYQRPLTQRHIRVHSVGADRKYKI